MQISVMRMQLLIITIFNSLIAILGLTRTHLLKMIPRAAADAFASLPCYEDWRGETPLPARLRSRFGSLRELDAVAVAPFLALQRERLTGAPAAWILDGASGAERLRATAPPEAQAPATPQPAQCGGAVAPRFARRRRLTGCCRLPHRRPHAPPH
jgi:hypothetical protein